MSLAGALSREADPAHGPARHRRPPPPSAAATRTGAATARRGRSSP